MNGKFLYNMSNVITKRSTSTGNTVKNTLTEKFWIYGSQEWADTGGRKLVRATPLFDSTEQLYDIMNNICDILNSKTALNIPRSSKQPRCKFGLSCRKAIAQPGIDHGHYHTLAEHMMFHILQLLYSTCEVSNDYSVSDDEDTPHTYTYKLPQNLYVVSKANADPSRIIDMLSTKWVGFLAGHESMGRFGATGNQKWCRGPICINYLDTKSCHLKHDNDVVVLTQLLRSLVTIERVSGVPADKKP